MIFREVHYMTVKRFLALASIVLGCCAAFSMSCDNASNPAPATKKALVLVKPAGGEKYRVGDTMKIAWQINDSSAIAQGSVIIWNSIDGGKTWPSTRTIGNGSFPLDETTYSWVIDSSSVSNNFEISVTDYDKGNRSQSGSITITN